MKNITIDLGIYSEEIITKAMFYYGNLIGKREYREFLNKNKLSRLEIENYLVKQELIFNPNRKIIVSYEEFENYLNCNKEIIVVLYDSDVLIKKIKNKIFVYGEVSDETDIVNPKKIKEFYDIIKVAAEVIYVDFAFGLKK